ncbi:Major facilitator family transporter [Pseudomonas amygdali pv. dendropanacis]|uniref:Major facilitator family transporter n=6 Tax=Pseudomonas syringae group genomosp. 2 TaxID=251698 RepID=A0A0N8RBZ0_PSEA0|nr:Major facilitator family transporter [Pseudomonas amygdali pv. dendropanacis]
MAGFLSPYLVGWIKDQTGSTTLALYSLAALTIVGSLVALRVSRQSKGKVAATA